MTPTHRGAPLRVGLLVVALACAPRYETRRVDFRGCPLQPTEGDSAGIRLRPAPETPAAILGTVHGEATGEPLVGVSVRVRALGRRASTDTAGAFRLDSVPPGRYALEAQLLGYRPRVDSVAVSSEAGAAVRVVLRLRPLDGCPGYALVRARKPWWKWW